MKFLVYALMFALFSVVVLADDVVLQDPADGYIDLDGNFSSFTVTVQAEPGRNISNVSLFLNTTGDWLANVTNSSYPDFRTYVNNQFNVTFLVTNLNLSDGLAFEWAVRVGSNTTSDNIVNYTFSTNRTARVEIPANVTLQTPVTANKSNSKFVGVNFTVRSDYIGSGLNNNLLDCRVYDNSSGSWTQSALGITAENDTLVSYPHVFSEANDVSWNVECRERNEPGVKAFASGNFTILVDVTAPSVTQNSPVDGGSDNDGTVVFNFTPTDTNLDSCVLYHNISGTFGANVTNKSGIVSGSPVIAQVPGTIGTGNYIWSAVCNDTVGNTFASTNFSLNVDRDALPIYNFSIVKAADSCSEAAIVFNTTTDANGSVGYGLDSDLGETAVSSTSRVKTHSALLDFGRNAETAYEVNATVCTAAGNCNSTLTTFTTPLSLCNEGDNNAGWSSYAVLSGVDTLGSIANESGASLVYWWNATGQAWVFNQNGVGSNAAQAVQYGHAVFLYSEGNETWFRNTTTTGFYSFNMTTGDNFFGITVKTNFTNLTKSFLNVTGGEQIGQNDFNFTNNTVYFAKFNNSAREYVSHVRGFSWEGATFIDRGEVAWTWVDRYNVSWNGTAIHRNESVV